MLAPALADDGADGEHARQRLRGERLAAPELVDLEVASVLRRLCLTGRLPLRRAVLAMSDLLALPVRRVSHRALLARCWELRDNLTVYDACYVTLAEQLNVTLVTADARLAGAPGLRCKIDLMTSPKAEPAASP